jgi:SsrA-binding protein
VAARKKDNQRFQEIRNNKLHRNFFVKETIEAGIALKGTEVKSLRTGKAQINDAFARFSKGELFLYGAHIDEYNFGTDTNHNPTRPRKLLLHRRELSRLLGVVEREGKTLIAGRLYFKHGLAKLELAVCTGKKLFDKREDLKKKTDMREAERVLKAHLRR